MSLIISCCVYWRNTSKEVTMRFVKDYLNLNHKLIRKPYPFPRIGVTMQQLWGFQCVTALDFNMLYQTIDISPESRNLTTIVTIFGKFRYNMVPMVMCDSSDIFQANVDDIIGDIQGVKPFINNILVLGKGIFPNIQVS